MLAQALAGRHAPRDVALEPKFDGYRTLVFTVDGTDRTVVQSRRGALLQGRFPDLVAAAGQLPHGLVLDGELVVWRGGQLSFEALQQRASAAARVVPLLAASTPVHFIAFDVLQLDGEPILAFPYAERRRLLEELFAEYALAPPWTLCPMTSDPAVAQGWLEQWTAVPGVEGVVIKRLRQGYRPGVRGWYKIRRRHTTEAVIGGVTGTLRRPRVLILGRYDAAGWLRTVGRTVPVTAAAASMLAGRLTAAGVDHPWIGARFSAAWGSREVLDVKLVVPDLVAEVDADTAIDGGRWRHPMRFARLRLDVTTVDVPVFGVGREPATG